MEDCFEDLMFSIILPEQSRLGKKKKIKKIKRQIQGPNISYNIKSYDFFYLSLWGGGWVFFDTAVIFVSVELAVLQCVYFKVYFKI